MIFLLRLILKKIWVIPADFSSSTTLWRLGRLPTGKISFGSTLVVGVNKVPMPAMGTIAFVIAILNVAPLAHIRMSGLVFKLTRRSGQGIIPTILKNGEII